MSLILMTRLFYKALLLQGEIWCWSLLGFKGLITTIDRKSKLVDAKNMIYMWGRYVLWWVSIHYLGIPLCIEKGDNHLPVFERKAFFKCKFTEIRIKPYLNRKKSRIESISTYAEYHALLNLIGFPSQIYWSMFMYSAWQGIPMISYERPVYACDFFCF